MANTENVPDGAIKAYKDWAHVLFEHFSTLLTTAGDSYGDLVRGGYENRSQYLRILDQLNKAESRFYKALRKDLKDSVENVGAVIKAMEKSLGSLRRQEANDLFPNSA
ncbi:MAG: hypothetical protein GY866_02695 [Proteobacteria bacterium]|nr:hypothetical protein [Pseudomonadota bacterium]